MDWVVDILFGIPAERVYKQLWAAAIYCGFEGRWIADSQSKDITADTDRERD